MRAILAGIGIAATLLFVFKIPGPFADFMVGFALGCNVAAQIRELMREQ